MLNVFCHTLLFHDKNITTILTTISKLKINAILCKLSKAIIIILTIQYNTTVFEAEKFYDGRPLFGAVRIRFADPMGSLDFYFRVVNMHLVLQDVSYFCLSCFPLLVREFLDAVNSDAISARVVV